MDPGSYLVREYARNLSRMTVTDVDGNSLAFTKLDKNTWEIETDAPREIRVVYRLYAHELSVRTNFLAIIMASLTGPRPFFMFNVRHRDLSKFFNSTGFWTADTGLKMLEDGSFEAMSLDELIDSPFIVGKVETYEFSFSKIPHRLSMVGDLRFWDMKKSVGMSSGSPKKSWLTGALFPTNPMLTSMS